MLAVSFKTHAPYEAEVYQSYKRFLKTPYASLRYSSNERLHAEVGFVHFPALREGLGLGRSLFSI